MHQRLRIIARSQVGWHDELFECAPPTGIQRLLGLIRPGAASTRERALMVIVLAWIPLVAFSAIDGGTTTLTAAMCVARYLIAAPLLVLAESTGGRRLTSFARHFAIGNFVAERDHRRYERILVSTRRLLRLPIVEILAWAGAYACSGWFLGPVGGHDFGDWSVAMRWNALVSLPLLLVLIFGWAWRLVLWCRFLVLVSRLDLRLVASHPDRAAGLGFVGGSLRAFSMVGFALSTIAAGEIARMAIQSHAVSTSYKHFLGGMVVSIVALFTLPIVAVGPALARVRRFAVMDYGELAVDVGRAFEAKWVARRSAKVRAAGLEQPDFSATIDLYGLVSNVHGMRLVPLALSDLVVLVAAAIAPFVPLVLLAVPPEVIWSHLRDMLR